jgi:hypothetical protein
MCLNAIYALHALLYPFCAGKYKQGARIAKNPQEVAISAYFANSEIPTERYAISESGSEVRSKI